MVRIVCPLAMFDQNGLLIKFSSDKGPYTIRKYLHTVLSEHICVIDP